MGRDRRERRRSRSRSRRDRRRRRRSTSTTDSVAKRQKKKRQKAAQEAVASGWDRGPGGGGGPVLPQLGGVPGAGLGAGQLVLSAAHVQGPLARVAAPATSANRAARRLFIGNLDQAMTQEMLRNFFKLHAISLRRKLYEQRKRKAQDAMEDPSTIPEPDDSRDPVIECTITRGDMGKAGFAFVELEHEDIVTECLGLDGTNCPLPGGRIVPIRVSRPNNYVPPVPALDGGVFGGGALPADCVANRLVMRGYPPHMSEKDVKPLLESMGKLALFDFLRDSAGKSQGQCIFAFEDPSNAEKCIRVTHGQDLGGGHKLQVERVSQSTQMVLGAGGTPGRNPEAEKRLLQSLLNLGTPIQQALQGLADCFPSLKPKPGVAVGAIPIRPTRFLCLLNMFDEDELEDDDEYDELFADIEQECERYGRVVELRIPRDAPAVPEPPEKPPEPPMLLLPQTTPPPPCVGLPPPPPGMALDPNTGTLLPMERVPEATREIENENNIRREAWEDRCDEIDRDYENAKERWERAMGDPVRNGVGKVFIEYYTVDEAHAAQVSLAGRHFGGRTVVTSFVPEEWMHPPRDEPAAGGGGRAETMEDILRSLEAAPAVRAIEDAARS